MYMILAVIGEDGGYIYLGFFYLVSKRGLNHQILQAYVQDKVPKRKKRIFGC